MGSVAAHLPQGRQDEVPLDLRDRQSDKLVQRGLHGFERGVRAKRLSHARSSPCPQTAPVDDAKIQVQG